MKSKFYFIGSFLMLLLFSSCAVHTGKVRNVYDHSTDIVLSKKNFIVVKSVKGEAKATYVFGIGGLRRKALITEAREKMLEQADLDGKPRMIINEVFERRGSFFPFIGQNRVTVSAQVIEFTD